MIEDRRRDVGYLFAKTGALIRDNLPLALTAIALLTLVDVLQEAEPGYRQGAGAVSLIVSLVFQYQVTSAVLVREGLAERGARGRFWALLGLNILSGVAILLGLLLLIVPGIYLLVRWSVSVPVLIAEDAGVVESLTRSGEEIEGRFWPVLGFGAVFAVALVLAASMGVALSGFGIGALIASSILSNATLVAFWHGAVAVYAAGRSHARIAEVFA